MRRVVKIIGIMSIMNTAIVEAFRRHKMLQKKRNENIGKVVCIYGKDILDSDNFLLSHSFIQHGKQSVFQHSVDVANLSLKLSRILPAKFQERELVRGALLHDYFLYDWHTKKYKFRRIKDVKQLHGFSHPRIALNNADKDFELSEREREIIRKHMWPLTAQPPMCREAWIVTAADKICSIRETICRF